MESKIDDIKPAKKLFGKLIILLGGLIALCFAALPYLPKMPHAKHYLGSAMALCVIIHLVLEFKSKEKSKTETLPALEDETDSFLDNTKAFADTEEKSLGAFLKWPVWFLVSAGFLCFNIGFFISSLPVGIVGIVLLSPVMLLGKYKLLYPSRSEKTFRTYCNWFSLTSLGFSVLLAVYATYLWRVHPTDHVNNYTFDEYYLAAIINFFCGFFAGVQLLMDYLDDLQTNQKFKIAQDVNDPSIPDETVVYNNTALKYLSLVCIVCLILSVWPGQSSNADDGNAAFFAFSSIFLWFFFHREKAVITINSTGIWYDKQFYSWADISNEDVKYINKRFALCYDYKGITLTKTVLFLKISPEKLYHLLTAYRCRYNLGLLTPPTNA